MRGATKSVSEFESTTRGVDLKVMPSEHWEAWFGHSSSFNYAQARRDPATSGPIVNYSLARMMDFLHWMTNISAYYTSLIDPNKTAVRGSSNGGCRCLQFAFNYSDVFASGQCTVPPTNILEINYGSGNYTKYFGGASANLPVSFMGWRSEKVKSGFEGTPAIKWFNLEAMLMQNLKYETALVHVVQGGSDSDVKWPIQGRVYPYQLNASPRGHIGGVNYTLNTHFVFSMPYFEIGGYSNIIDQLNRYEIVIAPLTSGDIADITLRRLQVFDGTPGNWYRLRNSAVNDPSTLYQSDSAIAGPDGLLTFLKVKIQIGSQTTGGSRLVITSFIASAIGVVFQGQTSMLKGRYFF